MDFSERMRAVLRMSWALIPMSDKTAGGVGKNGRGENFPWNFYVILF
jgi:hypothetical protein